MPNGNPQVGEMWLMRDSQGREQRGIVADLTDTIITLVSLTGQRFRSSPQLFNSNWSYTSAAPRTGLICVRGGCSDTACFRYRRDGSDEYTCPRHLPVSTPATYLTESVLGVRNTLKHPEIICPSCASPDPTPDFGVALPEGAVWSWWACHLCGRAWITVPAPPSEIVPAPDRGRWYTTTITSAMQYATHMGLRINRIDMGAATFGDIQTTSPEVVLDRVNVQLVLELLSTLAIIVLDGRPRRIQRAAMPVTRLGGRPNRPGLEMGAGPDVQTQEELTTMVRTARQESYSLPDVGTRTTPTSGGLLVSRPIPRLPVVNQQPTLPAPVVDVPTVPPNTNWKSRTDGHIVQVLSRTVEDSLEVVHFRREGALIRMSATVSTFRKEYEVLDESHVITHTTAQVGEEWSDHLTGETLHVHQINQKKMEVAFIRPDGKVRFISFRQLASGEMHRIVRRPVYAHLLDDETKE